MSGISSWLNHTQTENEFQRFVPCSLVGQSCNESAKQAKQSNMIRGDVEGGNKGSQQRARDSPISRNTGWIRE